MRKGRNCTFLHSVRSSPTLLRNKQETSVSRLKSLSRVGTTVIGIQGSAEGVIASSVFDAYLPVQLAEVVDLGELFADRARVRDDPGMRARSRRTISKSSSIAKNCIRSSSTWTCGFHRDKESLPNAKVQKPDWNTSAGVHNVTAEFPRILARRSELKGECDDSGSIIIHRKCGQDARCSSGHTSVSCVCRLNVATLQPIGVVLATKRISTRCVRRLNAA